ncbi:MAG: patatin-like phospholipase family protein [Ferruginibacter sp.]
MKYKYYFSQYIFNTMANSSEEFTNQDEVKKIIAELEARYGKDGKNLKVSDVVDEQGRQYVNLVQEGGGMLGIALVGFTYVLEKMNIRFWRLAGTSAGAINTIFLAAIGTKNDAKSEKVLQYLADTNFLQFADGHPVISRVLTKLTGNKRYLSNTIFFIVGMVCILLLSLFANNIHHSSYLMWFIIGILIVVGCVSAYFAFLWNRFKKRNYGLCRGNFFKKWLEEKLAENNISNTAELKKRAYIKAPDNNLQFAKDATDIRSGADAEIDSLESDVTMIACDITTQMKVEFPRMAALYGRTDENTNPAEFVRASMSIPIFFESQCFDNINKNDPAIIKAWKDISYNMPIPGKAYFADGGIISNFPISVFHKPSIRTPRLPVFGARLSEGGGGPATNLFKSIGAYGGAVFSTIRFNYDKEFLSKNNFYVKYVAPIDVRGFNWLNFAMSKDEQKNLFLQGVKAAYQYLNAFNWEQYKKERENLYDALQKASNT